MNSHYPLEERTASFSRDIIALCRKIKLDSITRPLVSQLVRSATSIGANYQEANGAVSRNDFKNKIGICKKEAKETQYWLALLADVEPLLKTKCQTELKESEELTLIFSKIFSSLKNNN